ncbi:MAG: hypothetical protein V1732_04870 [Patescibacteria group bacterium]|nr:hypothetical protein [Patescibacteria group bacterium]
MPLEDPDKKPPMKPEELNTILIIGGILFLYIVPAVILMIFDAGALEYLAAFSIFMIFGMIFWSAGAVLRD